VKDRFFAGVPKAGVWEGCRLRLLFEAVQGDGSGAEQSSPLLLVGSQVRSVHPPPLLKGIRSASMACADSLRR